MVTVTGRTQGSLGVTDKGLVSLAPLSGLQLLDVHRTQVLLWCPCVTYGAPGEPGLPGGPPPLRPGGGGQPRRLGRLQPPTGGGQQVHILLHYSSSSP